MAAKLEGNMSDVITLTLYKGDDEEQRTLTRSFLPWGILEMAIELQDDLAGIETGEDGNLKISIEQVRRLTDLVVFIFGDKVSVDELNGGASVQDMFSVFKQIFAMVGGIMSSNPTIGQAANRKSNLRKPAPK